jgi:hypothetical protein
MLSMPEKLLVCVCVFMCARRWRAHAFESSCGGCNVYVYVCMIEAVALCGEREVNLSEALRMICICIYIYMYIYTHAHTITWAKYTNG